MLEPNRTMKILFVSIYNAEALGTRQLFSTIKSKGYNTKLLFFKIDELKSYEDRQIESYNNQMDAVTVEEILLFREFVNDYKPDVISFSIVSPYFQLYKRLYLNIRSSVDFVTIAGGWQATLNPEETIKYADIICIGEGDLALPELIDNLSHKKPISDIKNLWIWQNGEVKRNPVRPLIPDLNILPEMFFDPTVTYYIEDNKLVNEDPYSKNTRYGVMAGRGCPYHCTYCSNSYMATAIYPGQWNKMRYRSYDNVIRELIAMKKAFPNIEKVNFYDEVFSPGISWLADFCRRYKNKINLPFYVMFYPGTCKEETLSILKDAGLSGVWLGVQSGSERVRKEVFKRHYSNDLILQQAALFKKYGVSVRYDFIFDNPFESLKESIESIALMLELPEPFSLNLFSLKYFPNTGITKMALDAGYITEKMLDDHKSCDQHNYLISKNNDGSPKSLVNALAMEISLLASKGEIGTCSN
jgi:radical SAM superfamily enzyme YgiQ (UPF0313 family)